MSLLARQSFVVGTQVSSSLQGSSSGSGIDGELLSSRLLREESCSWLQAVQGFGSAKSIGGRKGSSSLTLVFLCGGLWFWKKEEAM